MEEFLTTQPQSDPRAQANINTITNVSADPCASHAISESEDEVAFEREAMELPDMPDEEYEANPPPSEDQNIGFAARFAAPIDEGPAIMDDLAKSIDYLVYNKLEEKQFSETVNNYSRPSNCHSLLVPKCNKLIWENLKQETRTRDLKVQRCQKPLVKGITALTSVFGDKILTDAEQDALALLSNAMYELNALRKEFIKPELNQKFSHLCKHTVQPSSWLFGDNLPKTVKDMEDEQKSVSVMNRSAPRPRYTPYRIPKRPRFQQPSYYRSEQRPFLSRKGERYTQPYNRAHPVPSSQGAYRPPTRPKTQQPYRRT